MRSAAVLAGIASLCLAAGAFAAPPRLDDIQFIQANRCLGLMTSKTLATADAAALKQLIDSQMAGRAPFIYDKADEARETARRQADHGRPDAQAKLAAERDGVCHALLTATTTAAQKAGSHSS